MKGGGEALVGGGVREQIASELLDGELVVGHVGVKGTYHPIPKRPDVAVWVPFKSVGVRVARQVQPDGSPPLAEMRRR